MADEDIDVELSGDPERPEPTVEPYSPFPSFRDWLSAPFDFSTFEQYKTQLEIDKSQVDIDTLTDAVQVATRWAAANTGAIEGLYEVNRGFTYSVAASAAAWNNAHSVKGDSVAQHMQDALRAYEFVLDATTKSYPVSALWLRELHEIVTNSQDTYTVITAVGPQDQALPRGVYKEYPNSPLNLVSNTIHSYASPMDTPAEMQRFIDELRSNEFVKAHPIAQAAYSHYAFVCIHPFADGNGRVSRALASVFLYRDPGIPLVIFADQKGEYIDALEASDRGDGATFVRFIAERVTDTVGMIRAQISSALVTSIDLQMQELAPLLSGKDGLQHTEIDAIAARLLDVTMSAFSAQIAQNPVVPPLAIVAQRAAIGVPAPPDGYRSVPSLPSSVLLHVTSAPPSDGREDRGYTVAVAKPGTEGPDFIIFGSKRRVLEVELREMHPTVSSALVFRAEAEVLREIRETVSGVAAQAQNSLRAKGYL